MARAKFRPRRAYTSVYAAIVEMPPGMDNEMAFIPVGDLPMGKVLKRLSVKQTDRSLRRGVVELQGGIYHGFVTCPYAAHKRHRSENWQRAFTGCVAVNGGRQLTFQVEKTADGSERLVGRLVANLQQANAIVGSWQGEIVFPGMPTA